MNFLSKNEFSELIETRVASANGNLTFLEAIVEYCQQSNIEIEAAVKMLNASILEKIKMQASERNQIIVRKKKKKK